MVPDRFLTSPDNLAGMRTPTRLGPESACQARRSVSVGGTAGWGAVQSTADVR